MAAPNEKDNLLKTLPIATPGKCLKSGTKAPDFKLPLIEGGTWQLSKEIKNNPVVIVFYRGGWCPYCNLQLRSYDQNYEKIKRAGAKLIAISVDRIDKKIAKPTSKFSYPVASDSELVSINSYNVAYKVPMN